MCFGGRCLHCIPLEVGCLIMGYFQAVLFGVIALVFTGVTGGSCYFSPSYSPSLCYWKWMSVSFFVFSSLLVYSVHKKEAPFIMAYFAFGVVALALSLVFFLAITINGDLAGIAGLLVGVVYSHLLVMVYQTAKKIDLENVNTKEQALAGPSSSRSMNPPPYGKVGDGDIFEV